MFRPRPKPVAGLYNYFAKCGLPNSNASSSLPVKVDPSVAEKEGKVRAGCFGRFLSHLIHFILERSWWNHSNNLTVCSPC